MKVIVNAIFMKSLTYYSIIYTHALLQIMSFSWLLTTLTGLAVVLSIVWPQLLLLSTELLVISMYYLCKYVLGSLSNRIIHDLVLTYIAIEEFNPFMHVENLLDEIGKIVN